MNQAKLTQICPIFQVANLERSLDFYTRVLAFEPGWKAGEPPDIASVCRDAVEIMISVYATHCREPSFAARGQPCRR